MPLFTYKFIASNGRESIDTIEAISREVASEQLRANRVTVLTIEQVAEKQRGGFDVLTLFSFVRTMDMVLFYRQFATLIRAGIPVVTALELLEPQVTRRRLRKAIIGVRDMIEGGSSISDAMERYPSVFEPMAVSMIASGEAAGILDDTLKRVADLLEARSSFRTRVVTALMYPAVVVLVAIFAVAFFTLYVIPKIIPFISGLGGQLPWQTKLLIEYAEYAGMYWPYALGIVFAVVFIYILTRSFQGGRRFTDKCKIYLPIVGRVFHCSTVVQFSRNMAGLVRSGVPILDSLETIRDTVGNEAMADVVDRTHDRIMQGDSFAQPLREAGRIVPPILSGMVAIGEDTGTVDDCLDMVADIYDQILSTTVNRLTMMIEPVLTIMLGAMVAFLGWAIYGVIWSVIGRG